MKTYEINWALEKRFFPNAKDRPLQGWRFLLDDSDAARLMVKFGERNYFSIIKNGPEYECEAESDSLHGMRETRHKRFSVAITLTIAKVCRIIDRDFAASDIEDL